MKKLSDWTIFFAADFFLCRALLGARNVTEVENILTDKGNGCAVGFSVNATFLDEPGDRLFYNFEVGPSSPTSDQSVVNKNVIKPGEHSFHCNKYGQELPKRNRITSSNVHFFIQFPQIP